MEEHARNANLTVYYKDNLLDFAKTFSNGEYGHKYYSQRRVHRVLSLLNVDLQLNPFYENEFDAYYPFSVKVNKGSPDSN
jgi:dipeptidase